MSLTPESSRLFKHIGANVRRVRMAEQLTQEKLAEMADLDVRTLQRVEAGEINLQLVTFLKIRRALKCLSNRLLGE
jgi:transcriptional regulator with XRE-family HTH domain